MTALIPILSGRCQHSLYCHFPWTINNPEDISEVSELWLQDQAAIYKDDGAHPPSQVPQSGGGGGPAAFAYGEQAHGTLQAPVLQLYPQQLIQLPSQETPSNSWWRAALAQPYTLRNAANRYLAILLQTDPLQILPFAEI